MHTHSDISSRMITVMGGVLAAAMALLTFSFSAQATAIDLQLRHRFEIPSESLSAALTAFSGQSRIHVVTSSIPAGVVSPGIKGKFSNLDALTALLLGTGMSFRQTNDETLVVVPAQMAQLRATQFQLFGEALADQPAPAAVPAATASSELTEIQVTGTRIVRQGYEAPTPVTAVGIQELQDIPSVNVADTLNNLPAFQGSTTSQSNSAGPEGSQTELNLRNLGAQYTLVLFDGRRLPTSNTEAIPDLDMIPDALVQRVDVVTGGASAVYGSDAVAGVVNYVLDTNFTGVKGLLQGGETAYGDGSNYKAQLTWGTTFAGGRVHLILSADQEYQAEIDGTARQWNLTGEDMIQNPAYVTNKGAPEFIGPYCCVSTTYTPGGLILSGPLQGTDFGPGGTPGQYNYGYGLTTAGQDQTGGSWQEGSQHGLLSLLSGETTQHAFARVGVDITPSLQAYVEFMGGYDHTNDYCCSNYYQTGIGTMYTSNPYIPQSVLTQAANAGVTSFPLGETLNFGYNAPEEGAFGSNHFRWDNVYVLGLKGQFQIGKNSYNWDVYGQMGMDDKDDFYAAESIKANLSNAIQAVRVGSYGPNNSYGLTGYTAANYPNPLSIAPGTITCLSNLLPLSNPSHTSNCVPFNVFGSQPCSTAHNQTGQCSLVSANSAAYNYVMGNSYGRQEGAENMLGGSITGEPFSDWAGPVSIALDGEYRHESLSGFANPLSAQTGYFSANYFPTFGHEYVEEGALETVIPLVKGLPGVQELDANGGARATDYSVTGYVTTYKYGLEFTPINDLRFRATDSYDIRAPSLFQLFGYSSGHGTNVDPFAGNASIPSYGISGSNPNLRPEKAHQFEFGVVFQPSELPGFNLSIDYYHIKVDGNISTLGAAYELTQCYNTRIAGTFTGTSALCSLIVRTPCTGCLGSAGLPPGSLYSVETIPFNLASLLVTGVDYSADYRKQLTELVSSWKGSLELNLNATNTIHDITNSGIPGPAEILDATGTGNVPRWALFGMLSYELNPWRFVWTERYDSAVLGSNTDIVCQTNCPNPIPAGFSTVSQELRVPTYFLASLTVNYKFMEHDQKEAEAFINVHNLFNKIPPWPGNTPNQLFDVETNSALYDQVGMMIRAGIRFRL